MIATARPKRSLKRFIDNICMDAVALHNGAVVYLGEELFFRCGIHYNAAKSILLSINRDYPESTLAVEIDDILYANFEVSTDLLLTTRFKSTLFKISELILNYESIMF